ncbi:bifunctional tRNA (adenosine(37)-N6)-threonylcarbamoyltransferase complex ATPase subunit type 1 TsaE/phosphotransferase [Agaricicola taiwanensis]|uniref:tRNA threonylcarbamoyladenosine biosynthesis protein TsaE n=2 Tax=Agaricicola taiwanensis TaxID=591372 RepID=A0A8J2YBD8_9RHOB|nr:bifunctional tRNA (adenosine(37)-N6)-threonylcarbamoyltransferase complex ATPase subunit type 1 TsaE/phosphotransferase [Agaricicola taiwanensis]
MKLVASRMAEAFQPGDLIALHGDLGTGKSTFARAAIRALADDPRLEVPSPTYTIIQTYETRKGMVTHADLYRVSGLDEIEALGWDEISEHAIALVEWPERLGTLPADRLDVEISLAPERGAEARNVVLIGHGAWAPRLARTLIVQDFLDKAGWGMAHRSHIQGDASSRRYERLTLDRRTAILMDSPARPDGPPIRDGKPYSRLAHIAEDVRPFIALSHGLGTRGFTVPDVMAADVERGLLLLGDLGTTPVLREGRPDMLRYAAAVDLLVALHGKVLPHEIIVSDSFSYTLPDYDLDAMLVEAELLVDWYIPFQTGETLDPDERDTFRDLWGAVLRDVAGRDGTWVLRDFHSPNLMWLEEQHGIKRIGLLDFQDALFGSAAYDLVSLLQDARVDVAEDLELRLLSSYVKGRKAQQRVFDPTDFAQAYAIMGAQRATKILGIFARLAKRDGKPGYLRHIPRVWRYLTRDLAHPALGDLRAWYDAKVPPPEMNE